MKIFKNSLKIDFSIMKVFKKSLSRPKNIRVGRVTGNKTFSFFGLKYARITITHGCFVALTLAWSLLRCLSTHPISLMFKQPQELANVNA